MKFDVFELYFWHSLNKKLVELNIIEDVRGHIGRVLFSEKWVENIFYLHDYSGEERFLLINTQSRSLKMLKSSEINFLVQEKNNWDYILPLKEHAKEAFHKIIHSHGQKEYEIKPHGYKNKFFRLRAWGRYWFMGVLDFFQIEKRQFALYSFGVVFISLLIWRYTSEPTQRKDEIALQMNSNRNIEKIVERSIGSTLSKTTESMKKSGITTLLIHKDLDLTRVIVPENVTPQKLLQKVSYIFGEEPGHLEFWKISSRGNRADIDEFITLLSEQVNLMAGDYNEKMSLARKNIADYSHKKGVTIENLYYDFTVGSRGEQASVEYFLQNARDLYRDKKYLNAIDAYQKALSYLDASDDREKYFSISFNIGLAHKKLGGLLHERSAYEYFLLALTTLQRQYPDLESDLQTKLSQNGLSLATYVDQKISLPDIDHLLDIRTKIAKCQRNIGASLSSLGAYSQAVPFLKQASSYDEIRHDYEAWAKDQIHLANAAWYLGDFENATNDYSKVYHKAQYIEAKMGHDGAGEYPIDALIGIGNIAAQTGFLEYALKFFQKGLELTNAKPYPGAISALHKNMGCAYFDIFSFHNKRIEDTLDSKAGRLPANNALTKAREHLEKSLALREEINDPTLLPSVLNALAAVYFEQKNYEGAFALLLRAKKIASGTKDCKGLAETYYFLTKGLYQLKQHDQAAVLEDFQKRFKKDFFLTDSLVELFPQFAPNTSAYSNYPSYMELFLDYAYEIALQTNWLEKLWQIQFLSGQYYEQSGRDEEAFSHYRQALTITEEMRENLQNSNIMTGFIISKMELYQSLVRLLKRLNQTKDASSYEKLTREWQKKLDDLAMNRQIKTVIQRAVENLI
jgi:tetratricopeptide (TPR) repeat protein